MQEALLAGSNVQKGYAYLATSSDRQSSAL